mgnify:FL=1
MVLKEEQPTRSVDFAENEWASTHSNPRFFHKRVGTNPLEQTVLYKTSGSKQAQQASLSPAVQPKPSGLAQVQWDSPESRAVAQDQ